MRLLPRLRLAFARWPWLYWSLVGLCALVVWQQVSSAEAQHRQAAHAWGTTRPVWVVVADTKGGAAVAAARRDYPTAMLPDATVATLPLHPIAARHLAAGQILGVDDLVGDHTVPAGWVVLAAPADHAPVLATGDGVTVFHGGRAACDGIAVSTTRVQVDVAIPADCAASVSVDTAALVLARRPTAGLP